MTLSTDKIRPEYKNTKRTICQVLREIYNSVQDAQVKALVDEAHKMAKSMDRKLRENSRTWDEDFW